MNARTRRRLAAVAAVALAMGLSPAAGAAPDTSPITFLTAEILSGPFKVTDIQNLAGVQFAVEQINNAGGINGRPVRLVVIDTELSAAVTRRKATDAILRDHPSVIIGASGSDILRSLVSVGQRFRVPVISFAGEDDALTGSEFQPALFRVAASTAMHASALVFALEHDVPNARKVFLLNEDYSFGRSSAQDLAAALKRLSPGNTIVGNVFHPRGEADFTPYLQRVEASGADVLLTADWGADLVQLLNQAHAFGLKRPIGGTFLVDPAILAGVGQAAIGDFGADIYLPTIDTPENKIFVAAWHKAHAGSDLPWPTASVGKAYIATRLAADAIERAKSSGYDNLEHALEGIRTNSIAGPLTVRACDHQVQLAEATGVVSGVSNPFYRFPYVGSVTMAPLSVIAVDPSATGNPRCSGSGSATDPNGNGGAHAG